MRGDWPIEAECIARGWRLIDRATLNTNVGLATVLKVKWSEKSFLTSKSYV